MNVSFNLESDFKYIVHGRLIRVSTQIPKPRCDHVSGLADLGPSLLKVAVEMLVLGCVNDPDYRSFAFVLKHVALWFYYIYIVLNCHQQTVSLFTIGYYSYISYIERRF